MNKNTIVITGSDGATAQGLIKYFSSRYNNIIGLSRSKKTNYNQSNVSIIFGDMLDISSINNAILEIIDKYKTIDVWINCVGGFAMGSVIEETSEKTWDAMYSINFISCLNGCKGIIPILKKQNNGCIINFGSKSAEDGFSNAAPYLISKSAVHNLTKLISLEFSEYQARCNALLPGTIDTPSNRIAMPNENYNQWESIDSIGEKINSIINSDIDGELISV